MQCKSYSHFSAKNIRMLCIESAKTVNEMTLNELVKLTILWPTGPWYFRKYQGFLDILTYIFCFSIYYSYQMRTNWSDSFATGLYSMFASYVFYVSIFQLIYSVSCLISPGMVLQGSQGCRIDGKGKAVGPNLCVDRKLRNFSSGFKSCDKNIFNPCIFLRQILTENKVKSYLHTLALPHVS